MDACVKTFSLLLVEDAPHDADLLIHELHEAGYKLTCTRVETEADYLAALENAPDLILADYALPHFSGLRALQLLRERKLDIPFILVSGAIGEERAAEAMRLGATDYLLKDRLGRLSASVGSALAQKRLRVEAQLAEQELQETQVRLGAFLDNSPAITFMKDLTGRYVHVNRQFERAFGLKSGQANGKRDGELFEAAQAAQFRDNDRAALLSGGPREFEEIAKYTDGLHTNIVVRFPLYDAHGAVDGVGGIATDVTERRREEELYRVTFNQAALGIAHTGLDGRFLRVNGRLCEMLGYREEEMLARTFGDITHPQDLVASNGLREQLLTGKSKINSPVREKRYIRKDGSAVWVSITVSLVRNLSGEPDYFLKFVQDISERKAAEAKFRATFDHAAIGIVHTALDHRYLMVNQKACDLLGYTREELLAMRSSEIAHPDDPTTDTDNFKRVLTGEIESYVGTRRIIRKDGTVLWVNRTVSLVRDADGRPLYFIRVLEDVTGEQHAREALFESERFARSTIDALSKQLCVLDETGKILAVNKAWRDFAAANSADPLHVGEGANYLAICENAAGKDAAQAREFAAGMRAVLNGERANFALEYPCHAPGEQRWFNGRVSRFHGAGPTRLVVTHENITPRVVAEIKLQKSEFAYRTIFDQAAVGKSEADAATGRLLRVNRKMCEITGYTAAELCAMTFAQITHPDDVSRDVAGRERLIRGEIAEHVIEKRFVRKGGAVVWVFITVSMVRDAGGSALRTIATVQDVTQRREVEDRLRESESRFRSLTELSADWYWEQDAQFRFVATSSRSQDDAGNLLGSDILIGKTRWELPYADVTAEQWSRHRADLAARRSYRDLELKRVKPDGETRYVSISGQPIFDGEGRFTGYRGIGRDITERKLQENKIARLSRIHAVLSGINSLIVRVRDRQELFQGACKIAAEDGNFGMAWIGTLDAATSQVTPAASTGFPAEFMSVMSEPSSARADIPSGNGMVGQAIRKKRAVYTNDLAAEPDTSGTERRRAALQLGYRSHIVLPLIVQGTVVGSLALYAKETNFFNDDELKLLNELAGDISFALEYIDKEEKLNYLAYYDVITGLPNRSLFQDRLRQTLVQAQRNHWTVGVLFVDLDGFKLVNDTLGHALGDKLLQQAADRLKASVRSGDSVARFGGDEFGIILSDLASPQDAALVAQKILDAFGSPFQLDGNEAYVTASVGITLYPIDSEGMATLIKNADAAMYSAKAAGRNNYRFYTAEMNQNALKKMQLETRLRRAIERQEFVLHYQPKVDLISGNVSGLEALVRWQPPDSGLVPPNEFIPLLEETGLIVPVGEWVLREACRQIVAWRRLGIEPVPVAVNLSGRQFQQAGLDMTIAAILQEYAIGPRWIEIEITESSLMQRPDDAVAVLQNLKALGLRISIDDFGTGYSSLGYLKRFPLDALKVDRSFVRDVTVDADDASITRAIVTMAHSLNLKVIAEGVETEEQLAFLSTNRCDEVQGYLFSRPLPAAECGKLLSTRRQFYKHAAVGSTAEIPTVLLVDDDADGQYLLADILKKDGYRVLTAPGAAAALDLLAMHDVGLIVSDQNMPEMQGVEFFKRVRTMYPNVTRIMLSGRDDAPTLTAAINEGEVHRFFVKGRDDQALRGAIRNALWRGEPAGSAAQ